MNITRMKGRAEMMRTIKVTGKGKIAVKPDMIRLYVNKEDLCKEYEDILHRSTEDTELLKDLFEKLGFQRKDLKTVYFNVDTEYESYQDRDKSWKRRFEGYKYTHHMKIEFASDNKMLGQVLYALAHSSLKPEFSIEYTVADVEKCKNELLHNAIEDSVQKAHVLTTAANVKLGGIQPFLGYCVGAKNWKRKNRSFLSSVDFAVLPQSVSGVFFEMGSQVALR